MMKPKDLINKFVEEHLNGDWNQLMFYDLRQLEGDTLYSECPNSSGFDGDHTALARSVMYILYLDVWPGITWGNLANHSAFRGDTLNTFRSLFGYEENGSTHGLIKRNIEISPELSRRIYDFRTRVNCLANMVILPNKSSIVKKYKEGARIAEWKTLNTYRGDYRLLHDYVDLFLIELYGSIVGNNDREINIELLIQENQQAFEPYNSHEGFVELMHHLQLDAYLNPDGTPKRLFKDVVWWDKTPNDEYISAIMQYLDVCEPLIQQRGETMLRKLKEKM